MKNIKNSSIIEIDNLLISSEILTEKFCCDLSKCHGSCCIVGDSGAPLNREESLIIENQLPSLSKFLREEGILSLKEQGPYTVDWEDDLVTPLIDGDKECIYTIFNEEHTALCAIERAYSEGKSSIRKPISCWLYPIRVSQLSNGMKALNLDRWHLCDEAFKKGEREGIWLYQFLKEPLTFAYGESFFKMLEQAHKAII